MSTGSRLPPGGAWWSEATDSLMASPIARQHPRHRDLGHFAWPRLMVGPSEVSVTRIAPDLARRSSSGGPIFELIPLSAIARGTRFRPGCDRRIASCCGISTLGAS